MNAYVMANGDIIYIVVRDNSNSITFQLPDNKYYNSVILHINTSVANYTISLGPMSKVNIHIIDKSHYNCMNCLILKLLLYGYFLRIDNTTKYNVLDVLFILNYSFFKQLSSITIII